MSAGQEITPDVVEWLVGDDQVVQRWKNFAARLRLQKFVPRIDQNISIKKKKFEKQKLKEFMDVWKVVQPETFTKRNLMDLLCKEGLHDMYKWLELMETDRSPRKQEISFMLERSITPHSTRSLSPRPLSAQSYRTFASLPNSPYSWYFNGDSKASSQRSIDSDRESTPDSLSRPLSRLSACSTTVDTTDRNGSPVSILCTNGTRSPRYIDDQQRPKKSITFNSHVKEFSFSPPRPPIRKGTDTASIEKYFDNLVTMIEEAAEGL